MVDPRIQLARSHRVLSSTLCAAPERESQLIFPDNLADSERPGMEASCGQTLAVGGDEFTINAIDRGDSGASHIAA